jgi:hypothetical protein
MATQPNSSATAASAEASHDEDVVAVDTSTAPGRAPFLSLGKRRAAPADSLPAQLQELKDEKKFNELFKIVREKKNLRWTCPCGKLGSHRQRLAEHIQSDHTGALQHMFRIFPNDKAVKDLMNKSSGGASSSAGAASGEAKRMKSVLESRVGTMLGRSASVEDSANAAVAEFIIASGSAIRMVESEDFVKLLERFMELGRSTSQPASALIGRRTKATAIVDTHAEAIIKKACDKIGGALEMHGGTLTMDGRTNALGIPVTAMQVEAGGHILPLGALPANDSIKNSGYYIELVESILSNESPYAQGQGSYIIGLCVDGAAVNDVVRHHAEENLDLLTAPCNTHRLSLLLKDVTKMEPFDTVKAKIDTVTAWVRQHQVPLNRFKVLAKDELEKDIGMPRPIEIRFGTYPFVASRLLECEHVLKRLIVDKEYTEYIARYPPTKRAVAQTFKAIILDDDGFWDTLRIYKDVAQPILAALRICDQYCITPSALSDVWEALGSHLVKILKQNADKLAVDVRRALLDAFCQRLGEACVDVMDAAWVLDPRNLSELRRMSRSKTTDDEETFTSFKNAVHSVLRRVTARVYAGRSPEERSEILQNARLQFARFCNGFEEFKDATPLDASAGIDKILGWWSIHDGRLAKLAPYVLCFTCTISNVERLHKLYAMVQNESRTRLTAARCDRLVLAAWHLRCERLPPKESDVGVPRFLADADDDALGKYIEQLEEELLAAKAEKDAAAADVTGTDTVADMPEESSEDAREEERERAEAQWMKEVAEAEAASSAPLEVVVDRQAAASSSSTSASAEPAATWGRSRTGRVRVLTSRMRAALRDSGLGGLE